MSNFYRYANLEAEHFFCVEEASADCQQAILLVNYENFFCGAKFRIDLLNVFAEHVTSLLDELLDPRTTSTLSLGGLKIPRRACPPGVDNASNPSFGR